MNLLSIASIFFFNLLLSISVFAAEPTILFEEDPTSLVSTVEVAILSGGSDDPINKAGLTNFYSELMLRGTKTKNRAAFQSALERMGATLGAYATNDKVLFVGKVIKENTFQFMKLLEECLLHPSFSKNEFDSLKTELLNEVAHIKNSNNRLGGLTLRKELFRGTPLEYPLSGSLSTLKAIQPNDVVRAYNNAFHKANMMFVIASPIKEAEWKKTLMGIWTQLPDGARLARKVFTPKVPTKPTLIVIHKAKTSTGVLTFAQVGMTAQEPLRYVLSTGNFSFGGEPLVSRLFRTIRGQLGWTYAIGSGFGAMGSPSYQPGIYTISSTPSIEFTGKTLLKVQSSWEEYLDNGLAKDELLLAKESLINSYPFEFENAEKRLNQRLHSHLYGVPVLSPEEYTKTIDAISNTDIKNALKQKNTRNGWLMTLVADKDVVEKLLEEEQKDIPKDQRIVISKVVNPDQVVE